MAGAPVGNDNARRGREFKEGLRRVLARKHGTVQAGIEVLAGKLADAAEAGESWALIEVANRLEGKPEQAITGEIAVTDELKGPDAGTLSQRITAVLAARAGAETPENPTH